MNQQSSAITDYLREIGRRGGQKSTRRLPASDARRMVAVREARKAFRQHKTDCFWSFDPEWRVGVEDVPLVIQTLRKEGNRQAFEKARSLQRLWEN